MQQVQRFRVTLYGRKGRWRDQNEGLLQGSILAPLLFKIYTNNQLTTYNSKHFLYANNLAIAVQDKNFGEVELKFERALSKMSAHYAQNSLIPNSAKTKNLCFPLTHKRGRRGTGGYRQDPFS